MEHYETKIFFSNEPHFTADIDAWLGEFSKWIRNGYRSYEIVSYISIEHRVLITVKRWESQYQKDA